MAAALVLALGSAQAALADGGSAIHSLFSNLAKAKAGLGAVNEGNAQAQPTLVKGIYAIRSAQGQFVGYTNDAGTLFGDSRGFSVVSVDGAPPRRMNAAEVAELRQDVVSHVDYDKLIKVSYGDGGGRRLLMFSAVDCVHCKAFEESIARVKSQVSTTFFVIPASLNPDPQSQGWQVVSRIWCSEDKSGAWLAYWNRHAVPAAAAQCEFQPRVAPRAYNDLISVFKAVGVRVVGTPNVVREDGAIVPTRDRFDAATAQALFGEQAAPRASSSDTGHRLVGRATY